jgi:hypothetical protein
MEEEIIPRLIQSRGNLSPGLDDPNKPPTISIEPVTSAKAGDSIQLIADVTDDGLPNHEPPNPHPRPTQQNRSHKRTPPPRAHASRST